MPISGIGSYAPTMQEFINHWTQVNASLGANPLLLRGGYTLANFTTDRTNIVNAINTVIATDNVKQTASGNLDWLKFNIRQRPIQFRKVVEAMLQATGYINALPVAPAFSAVESRFVDPLEEMRQLWVTINADTTVPGFTPPILVAGGYTVATFTTDLTGLRAAFITAKNANEQATLARKQRDVLLKPAEQRMKQYRELIQGRFDPTSAFVQSLPSLTPLPGSTPEAVEFLGHWENTKSLAMFTWEASTNSKLDYYEVRVCIGSTYRVANEFNVSGPLRGVLKFDTKQGVIIAGAKAVYRVYVVLTTGNERGSNDVLIERP